MIQLLEVMTPSAMKLKIITLMIMGHVPEFMLLINQQK